MKATLNVLRGDSIELSITLFQTDGITPFDLSGGKVWSSIKKSLSDLDAGAVSRVDSDGGSTPAGGDVTITDAVNGIVVVRHSTAATETVGIGSKLYYDIQVKDSVGRVFTPVYGTICIVADVTQVSV